VSANLGVFILMVKFMKIGTKKISRRSIRLKGYDYTQSNWYFITICVKNKEYVFGEIINGEMNLNGSGKIVQDEWIKSEQIRINIELDYYQIMPNHLHGIVYINKGNTDVSFIVGATGPVAPTATLKPNSLGSFIGQFKSVVTKRIRKNGMGNFNWQRNYFERVIRDEEELNKIRKYIIENPLKWGKDEYNQDSINKKSEIRMMMDDIIILM
jgi:putative transposase